MKKKLFVITIGMVMTVLIALSAGIMFGYHYGAGIYSEDYRVDKYVSEFKEENGYDYVFIYNTEYDNWNGTDRVTFDYAGLDESGKLHHGWCSGPLE